MISCGLQIKTTGKPVVCSDHKEARICRYLNGVLKISSHHPLSNRSISGSFRVYDNSPVLTYFRLEARALRRIYLFFYLLLFFHLNYRFPSVVFKVFYFPPVKPRGVPYAAQAEVPKFF